MSSGRAIVRCAAAVGAFLIATGAAAEPEAKPHGHVRLDETVISGNAELPKVLYIVPWQDPTGIPKIELDPNFTEHEVFRRVDPQAYKRELQYYDVLKASQAIE